MATWIQRGQSIGDALLNAVASLGQLDRLGRALAYHFGRLAEYDAANNAGKAQIYVESLFKLCVQMIKHFESAMDSKTAGDAAVAKVDTDFQQTP